ncbi:hypothetical protein MVEN_01710100 [Mycena venus]|uniref:CHAT domain-containing protein n=1 Tax=Mycena venus TaxID=2733690 RepID=A0A8H6XPN3_9AGAR|nr:hypothetical protein MVEN_01710100 [Mycena venus]
MKVLAQLIVDGIIIQQTISVDGEQAQDCATWKLKFDSAIPPQALSFRIAILRETKAIRLLGFVDIRKRDSLLLGENQRSLSLPLEKVNLDGPVLNLTAIFSFLTSTQETSALATSDYSGIPIGSVDALQILLRLRAMWNIVTRQFKLKPQELWVLQERILLLPPSNAQRGMLLNLLGSICLKLWEEFQMLDVLHQAVCAFEDAVREGFEDAVHGLGISLRHRAAKLNEVNVIIRCVSVMKDSVRLTPDGDPQKPFRLRDLGSSLLTSFGRLGGLDTINSAVSVLEDAVLLTPDDNPYKLPRLNALGSALVQRFEWLHSMEDLSRAILVLKDAVHMNPSSHLEKESTLNKTFNLINSEKAELVAEDAMKLDKILTMVNLGTSLVRRYEQLGALEDLNNGVLIQQRAVQLTSDNQPDKPAKLSNLGSMLLCRFERLGELGDLNQSISVLQNAVHLCLDNDPFQPLILANLGNALVSRFERLGDVADLNIAVPSLDSSVLLTPDNHPEKLSRFRNLGQSLFRRYERLNDLADLNRAIDVLQNSVDLTPDGRSGNFSTLNFLGSSFLRRFEQHGDLGDLRKAQLVLKDALCLTPNGHPDRQSVLNSLGGIFLRCFERLANPADLSQAVEALEEAVHLTPDGHPYKPVILDNYGKSLLWRFGQLGDLNDLHHAVSVHKEAIQMTPDNHPYKPLWLTHLGGTLLNCFEKLGDLDDLHEAVSVRKQAVELTPDTHPHKPLTMVNFGDSLLRRYQQLGNQNDLDKTVSALQNAACLTSGPAHIRFKAVAAWADIAQTKQLPSLLDACKVALTLLPELAWLGLSISDRHYHLSKAGRIVRNAATAAIAHGQVELAVEWLEQGRSIIWGQLLSLRSPLDVLSISHPSLAQQLLSLSAELDGSTTRASSELESTISSNTPQSLLSIAHKAHQNAYEREQLLEKIRSLDGFSRFLLPKPISELLGAARMGPVVILNSSDISCDALALMPGLYCQVLHIPLPQLTPQDAAGLAYSISNLVKYAGRGERLSGVREGESPAEEDFARILSELWLKVMRPILDELGIKTPVHRNHPRLYGDEETFGSKLSDFVISSYTPSLTALNEGFQAFSEHQRLPQLLAVAEPSALGAGHIPGTQEEIGHIQRLAEGKLPLSVLAPTMATVDRVEREMKSSSWVHFACHGVQDLSHPTESALLLAGDSRLTLSKIIKLSLPHAEFAFLSACQTATGDMSLAEESVHLAAGMLMAGYRGVIATMWTIMDNDAPQVAADVYEHLFKTSPPDPTRAAEALYLAVQKLRTESGRSMSFFNWVPYIHVGV